MRSTNHQANEPDPDEPVTEPGEVRNDVADWQEQRAEVDALDEAAAQAEKEDKKS
jgi:hypothetical protein